MVERPRDRPIAAVELCSVDELWDGEMQGFRAGDTTILLVKVGGRFHAYQGHCPHQGTALADGDLDGALLTCAAHRWQFDVASGRGVNPKSACLRRFPVRIVERRVLVEVEPGEPEAEPPAPAIADGGWP